MLEQERIAKAVQIYRENPSMEDREVFHFLVHEGIDPESAAHLVDFLPMAYARTMFSTSGARFPETFQRTDKNGNLLPEQALTSEPFWNEVFTYAQSDVQRGISTQDLLAVASRAAEYNAVSKIQSDGGNLSDCEFSSPIFIHPEMDSKGFDRLNKSLTEKYHQLILLKSNKNGILASILTEHHIPTTDCGEYIQIDGTDVLLQAMAHPGKTSPKEASVQLDIILRSQKFLGNRELRESFADTGENLDDAINKSFTSFKFASLHAILSVFVNRDLGAGQVEWEEWSNNKRSWNVYSGPITPKSFTAVAPEKIINGESYRSFMKALQNAYLRDVSFDLHWLRIYRGSLHGKVRSREVLLDGEHWKSGEAIMDKWDWLPGPDFYSIRQFMIAVPIASKKQRWQFWR
jgi:hypothetical protein